MSDKEKESDREKVRRLLLRMLREAADLGLPTRKIIELMDRLEQKKPFDGFTG